MNSLPVRHGNGKPAIGELKQLIDRLNTLLSVADFIGIGNLLLESLLGPYRGVPDDIGKFLIDNVPVIVGHRFGVPAYLTYGCPHRDEHVEWNLRGDWNADWKPQLIIFAYTIGATLKRLPPPHDKLVQYYLTMAEKQRAAIEQAASEHQRARPALSRSDELDKLLEAKDHFTPEELKREIMARLNGGQRVSNHQRTINPE